MYIGKTQKLSELHVNEAENKIIKLVNELKLHISIKLNQRNIKAESRLLERILKESLDELPPTTVFTSI